MTTLSQRNVAFEIYVMARPSTPKAKSAVTRGLRVGGRSQRVVSAVLRATAEEMARHGYEAFQIEEVARKAAVNRTSIYRRWPTKEQLVEAALRELSPFRQAMPSTGDLAADFLTMLRNVLRWTSSTQGRSLRRMVGLETDNTDLRRIVAALRAEFLAPWLSAIGQAKRRGEIAREIDAELLTSLIVGPVIARIDAGDKVDQRMLASIVRIVLKGARPEPAPGRKKKP
jgi:AcrR family transcriptional regulator